MSKPVTSASYARIAKLCAAEARKPNSVAARVKEQSQAVRAEAAAERQRQHEAAVARAQSLAAARKAEEAENKKRELAERQRAAEEQRRRVANQTRVAKAQAAARAEAERMLQDELDAMEPEEEPTSWRSRLEWDDELRQARRRPVPVGQQSAALDAARQPGETDAAVAQRMLGELQRERQEMRRKPSLKQPSTKRQSFTMPPAPLLADRRPPAVRDAINDHAGDAASFGPRTGLTPMRWERDAAANYSFGETFGSGRDAVAEACARAEDEGRDEIAICDVGCGSGGFLATVATEAAADAGNIVLRAYGLTGGRESCGVVEGATIAECDDWRSSSSGTVRLTGSYDAASKRDVVLLQRFPIEDVLNCDAASFVHVCERFDLIVCSWTLRHCADPLGTLEQYANLLRVGGVLLANQFWLPFEGESGRWDDEAALRRAIAALNNEATGVSLELDITRGEAGAEEGEPLVTTALRCVRVSEAPIRFASAGFTGEVSGPMSLDPSKSVCCLSGGPSYAMARYRCGEPAARAC